MSATASVPRSGVLAGRAPGQPVRVAATLSLAHAVNDSYSFVLQAVLPALIVSLGLTVGMGGTLVSLYQLTSSLVQPIVGHLADRGGLRWPIFVGLALSGVAASLLGLAPGYLPLVGLLIVGGVGTAIFHPVSAAMVGAVAPARARGRWIGLYVTAGNYGLALGPLMLSPLLDRFGPSGTWPIVVPALLVAAILVRIAPRQSGPVRTVPPLKQILRKHWRLLSSLVFIVSLRAFASTATVTFIPLLARERGLSLGDAALALTVYLASGATGGLAGGFAADRWGRDPVLRASLALSAPFGLAIAFGTGDGLLFYVPVAAAGFFLNGSFVVLTIRGQESLPGSVGMMTGIMLGLSTGLGGLAVTPLALLGEVVGLSWATAVAALFGGSAALATLLLPRPARLE